MSTYSFGQSIERFVIGSTGNFTLNAGYSLSATTGEAVVQTIGNSSDILTQGFQQSEDFSTSISETLPSGVTFNIYPNPTSELLVLDIHSSTSAINYLYKLTDVLGRNVSPLSTFEQRNDDARILFNMGQLPAGIYFLHISSDENQSINHSFKISKIN